MLHFYDRAGFARALTLDLEPRLKTLLVARIEALTADLINFTEYLVVEAGDREEDIIRAVSLSPLIEPIEGARLGQDGFEPGWDYLTQHDGWFELIYTFGSSAACIVLIADAEGVPSELLALCRHYSHPT